MPKPKQKMKKSRRKQRTRAARLLQGMVRGWKARRELQLVDLNTGLPRKGMDKIIQYGSGGEDL